jgi:type III pantothenate kinase
MFPNSNILVIDAGTCITYDFIDKNGVYQGGAISPGINLKLKALNTFTQKLPLIEFKNEFVLIGQTTEESILSGVLNGTIAEIEGIIGYYSHSFSDLKTIICGGASNFFESKIKAPIFVVPELVLIGLNRILQYNVSKN